MQKVACIFSFKKSSWISCQKIVFNLHKAYQLNKQIELLNFNYSSSDSADDINSTARAIVEAAPEVIIIMDHKPHPLPLFQCIVSGLELNKLRPRIVFHIFGDFSLYYGQWNELNKLLEGYAVEFIVASKRQKQFLDKYLTPPMVSKVCSFPVSNNEFFYNPSLRTDQRNEWGLQQDDIAFVFAGRISRQKRIHTVLKCFSEMLVRTQTKKAHLFLYGNPDHLGDQFIGIWETEGEYFRKVNRLLRSFPEEVQSRIHFMGGVSNNELTSVYQGADYLLNISVHNDEDYGMSAAEALCSGLPAILSDWGGLAGFRMDEIPEAVTLVPVKIGKEAKLVHAGKLLEAMIESLKKGHVQKREAISKMALSKYSIEAASNVLSEVLNAEPVLLKKFSPLFERVRIKTSITQTPYITSKKTINSLFRDIYSAYVRDDQKTV